MVFDVAVLLLALVALAGSGRAVMAYMRGRCAGRADRASSPVAMVIAGDPDHPLTPVLVRSAIVSEAGPAPLVSLAHGAEDAASRLASREASSVTDPTRVVAQAADPPPRVFPAAWLQALAAGAVPDGTRVVVFVDPRARPAAHEIGPVAAAVAGGKSVDAAGACPVAAPRTSGPLGTFLARLGADLAPLLVAWYGPAGLPPACVALRRDLVAAASRDPLSVNRLGLAFSALMSVSPGRAVLLPRSVGTLASGDARSFAHVLSRHLSVLARISPGRTLLLGLGLAATPVSVLVALLSGSTASLGALILTLVARAFLATTWTHSVQGTGPAVGAFLSSPLRDAASLGTLLGALVRRTVRSGGRLFRIRRGGILVPAGSAPVD